MAVIVKHAYPTGTTLDDINFDFTQERQEPDYASLDARIVEEQKRKTAELVTDRKIDDNPLFTLLGFDGNRVSLAYSTYGTYKTYKSLIEDKTRLRPQSTYDLCSLIIELITADNFLVLGYRKGEHLGGKYLAPAGFTNFDAKERLVEGRKVLESKERFDTTRGIRSYFQGKTQKELREEVGLLLEDWSQPQKDKPKGCPIRVTGLGADTNDSFLTVLNLSVTTNLSRDEVQWAYENAGNPGEHPHLIYLPNDPDHIKQFILGKYSGEVGTTRRPICFAN
ncbi:MAG: hypothetical protein Q7R56_00540, partial [Nanoarchaeota archaeon]|nr:hypothetical protein [Nanoarchaeota archaeon]